MSSQDKLHHSCFSECFYLHSYCDILLFCNDKLTSCKIFSISEGFNGGVCETGLAGLAGDVLLFSSTTSRLLSDEDLCFSSRNWNPCLGFIGGATDMPELHRLRSGVTYLLTTRLPPKLIEVFSFLNN